jgi:undecaprenyl diphosphate synthase
MSVTGVQAAADEQDGGTIPGHVAIIMDGNGRWAEGRSKPRQSGHRAGVAPVRKIVEHAARRGVSYLTLFAFSSENWQRPRLEVSKLMGLFIEALQRELNSLHRNNVRLRFIGARDRLQPKLIEKIAAAEAKTAANTGLTLVVAVAYGGRWDMVNAARKLAERVVAGELQVADIDESQYASELSLAGIPDPDLLIRTGGEQRISNFLLWNLAYAELYFCECLWPDFTGDVFDDALQFFAHRQRRYGTTEQQRGAF